MSSSKTSVEGPLFSTPKVSMSGIKRKLAELRDTALRAPKENKPKIREIIELYAQKKIRNFRTAENAINRLAFATKNKDRVQRAEADYKAIIAKYKDAEPMTGRLDREIELKRLKKRYNISITMILYRKAEKGEEAKEVAEEATVSVDVPNQEAKEAITKQVRKRTHKDLVQFYIGTFDLNIDEMDERYLHGVEETLIRRELTEEEANRTSRRVRGKQAGRVVTSKNRLQAVS